MDFTVDWESDWGGRSNETRGIRIATPIILALLKKARIRGVFFISTEVLEVEREMFERIVGDGHTIGSHGHQHVCFKEAWRAEKDKEDSKAILNTKLYRAPKFSYAREDSIYSNPRNHVSLLRHMWLGEPIKKDTIFYMHPFDIVGGDNPPNLFCRLWYSKPREALKILEGILKRICMI